MHNLDNVASFLNKMNVKWYVNAGFALHLQGLSGDLSDVDIRVFYDDLTELYKKFEDEYGKKAYLRPPLDYKYGKYDTLCIELSLDVKYDIYSKVRIVRDGLGTVEFPLDEESFDRVCTLAHEGLRLPVAPLERLLAYYIVLRRNDFDNETIKRIIAHPGFRQDTFDEYLQDFEKYEEINQIYQKLVS